MARFRPPISVGGDYSRLVAWWRLIRHGGPLDTSSIVTYPPLPLLLALEPFEQVGTIRSRTASPRDRFQSTRRRDLIERQQYGGPGPEIRRARPTPTARRSKTRSGSTRS